MKIETVDISNAANGQFIPIPEEMRIDDSRVYLKKTGNTIVVIPFNSPWEGFLESLNGFTPDFMEEREQPAPDHRESLEP